VGSDLVVIGASEDDTGARDAGAAYLFNVNGTLLTTFTNPTPADYDSFGRSVAAVGSDRVLIGAYSDDTGAENAGAAYLFSTNGTLLTTFTNPTPAPASSDYFGTSVAAVGTDRVLIGARTGDLGASAVGAAYLFNADGTLLTCFTNPTPEFGDSFGFEVAAMGRDRVVIAAPYDNTGATYAGAVYLFNTNGGLLNTFTNPTPVIRDNFGFSVAVVGSDRVLIGTRLDDTGATDAGVAYLFNTNGTLLTTFTNPTPEVGDQFGGSVAAVGNDRVLIGASQADRGVTNAGAAYLFDTNGTLLAYFANPTPAAHDYFGCSVAAVGHDRMLIGAYTDDTGAIDAGVAYLFNVRPPSATTLPAANVINDAATLNGTVTPNGLPTTAWFEWGATTNYGNVTAPTAVAAGAPDVQVTSQISPLLAMTTYHFRLLATNSIGTSAGMDRSFTTLSANANLANLVLSSGPLAPAFNPAITNYTAIVPYNTNSVTVTPTSADANATIQVRVNGGAFSNVLSGTASPPLPLNVGTNFIDVKVTAQDLTTIKTYTVAITVFPATELRVVLTSTNTLLLAWPAALTGCGLEQNADLTTTNWLAVTNPPVVVGDEKLVIVNPPVSGQNFYRLNCP
jgi:hypothetical protein